MELKCMGASSLWMPTKRFNRTFMELKFTKGREHKEEQACFNRTFMELKYEFVY